MANRESFNLFNKRGRCSFFRRGIFGDKWSRKFVIYDTIIKPINGVICFIFGHNNVIIYIPNEYPRTYFCSRCGKELNIINEGE